MENAHEKTSFVQKARNFLEIVAGFSGFMVLMYITLVFMPFVLGK